MEQIDLLEELKRLKECTEWAEFGDLCADCSDEIIESLERDNNQIITVAFEQQKNVKLKEALRKVKDLIILQGYSEEKDAILHIITEAIK